MAKIEKDKYTKKQFKLLRDHRRSVKRQEQLNKAIENKRKEQAKLVQEIHPQPTQDVPKQKIAFVLGNGTSRATINPYSLRGLGKIYGCNALYREFEPDYLVAVDTKMVLEINKAGYQHKHEVWTNPNRSYSQFKNFNYFNPSKGWSSGPTALWLASEHSYDTIFILGFDYKGLEEGKFLNNIYADTPNYKKSNEGATFFGNWMRQTSTVIKSNPDTKYIRVINEQGYIPKDLAKFDNLQHVKVEDFELILAKLSVSQ